MADSGDATALYPSVSSLAPILARTISSSSSLRSPRATSAAAFAPPSLSLHVSDCEACADCAPLVAQLQQEKAELLTEVEALQAQIQSLLHVPSSPTLRPGAGPPLPHTHRQSSVLPDGTEVFIAEDELAAMAKIFTLFDKDADGLIDAADLAALHARLGEPVDDSEAREAVATISRTGDATKITFSDFASYWDGSHPSLRKARATGEAAAVDAERLRRRQHYRAKFKFLQAKIPSSALGMVYSVADGVCPSLSYRVRFFFDEASGPVPISPWHDVPLRNGDGTLNMVVEIPKFSRKKFEIATGEAHNPIHQDVKNGLLREYGYGDQLVNYGAFPQTYEDPAHISPDTGCCGDNDPLDCMEIGSRIWSTGAIVRVKPLGVLALIDEGETDWKVIVISVEDPMADLLNDISDVEAHMPGCLEAITRWLKLYKSPAINEFAFGAMPQGRAYSEAVIEETHQSWKALIARSDAGASGGAGTGGAIAASGLKRSSSKSALQSLLAS